MEAEGFVNDSNRGWWQVDIVNQKMNIYDEVFYNLQNDINRILSNILSGYFVDLMIACEFCVLPNCYDYNDK